MPTKLIKINNVARGGDVGPDFLDSIARDASAQDNRTSEATIRALLTDVLIERRNRIAASYLPAILPLVDFALTPEGRFTFRNAAVDAGVATTPTDGYRATWSRFDNATDDTVALAAPTTTRGTEMSAPAPLPTAPGAFVRIDVAAAGPAPEAWSVPVKVYFERRGSGWTLVGVERLP
jgi:hypothetical protein